MKFFLAAIVMLASCCNSAFAQDNANYKDQLCDKVKQCRLGQIVAADMPEFMQDIIVNTIDTQCLNIASSYEGQLVTAGLEDEAKLCVHSLEDQSCEELVATQGQANTVQCDDFLKLAEAAGIDFSKIEF